jgi:hypothetical protein
MHPVDTIKTLSMASEDGEEDEGGGYSPDPAPKPRSPLPPLSELPKLYRGLSANLLKEGPPSALYLGIYESVKSLLLGGSVAFDNADSSGNLLPPLAVYLIAGAAGEMVGTVVRAPSEAVKTKLQVSRV